MTRIQPRLRAASLAILLILSGSAALGSTATALQDGTPIVVVRGVSATGGSEDAYPFAVADELRDLLDAGGLANVREVEAATGPALLDALRAAEAVHLVVVAHGAPEGLAVGDDLVPWAAVRDALAESPASFIYLGACHSAALGEVEGKRVVTAFEGEVDRRVVAPQIASDMFAAGFPLLDPAFERHLLAHVEANGGLDAYARLLLLPQETLQDDRCANLMNQWYDGAAPASAGECIFYLDPANMNCHAAEWRGSEPCATSSAAEQQALNRDSVSSASAREAEGSESSAAAATDEFSTSWWATMQRTFGAQLHTDAGTVTIQTGPGADCVTIVKLEHLQAGGLTFALQAFLKEVRSRFGSATNTPVAASADASILALRVCGSVEVSSGMTEDGETRFGAAGELDARVSMYFTAEMKVFRWTRSVSFEAGVMYPAKIGLEGRLSPCRNGDTSIVASRIVVPIEAGSAGLFLQAQAGWGSLGAKYDFGGTRDFSIDSRTRCPDGWSPYATPDPTVDRTLQRLLSAGLAVVNPEPTVLGEDGLTTHTLQNAFVILEPGTATWRGHAADGTLARLGIPVDLPPSAKVVVDVTNADVLRAFGRHVEDVPVPEVSLLGGVAILPSGTPTSASTELFCEGDVQDGGGVLHASACAGVVMGPIPQAYADASWSLAAPQESLPVPDPSPVHDLANDAVVLTCGATPLLAPVCAEGRSTTTAANAAPGGLDLLAAIHSAFQIVERPGFAQWLVSTCHAEPLPEDTSGRVTTMDVVPTVRSDGSVGMGRAHTSACMEIGEVAAPRFLQLREVADQIVLGNVLLSVYAMDGHGRFGSAFSDGQGPIPDVVGRLDPVFEALSETECELINVCPEGGP